MDGSKESHAATVLGLAERILRQLEGSADSGDRNRLFLQASFLVRLAAALLVEADFPALPDGFWRLLDRDRARAAARQLAESRGSWYRSFSKHGTEPAPPDRAGSPREEIDHRLAAQTAATLEDLRSTRLDLFSEYLDLANRDDVGSQNPEVRAASLALLDGHWRSRRRLLQIETARAQKPRRRSRHGRSAKLRPPLWEAAVTGELWLSLDPRFLLWSDPLPTPQDDPNLSQHHWPLVATTLSSRNSYVK